MPTNILVINSNEIYNINTNKVYNINSPKNNHSTRQYTHRQKKLKTFNQTLISLLK